MTRMPQVTAREPSVVYSIMSALSVENQTGLSPLRFGFPDYD